MNKVTADEAPPSSNGSQSEGVQKRTRELSTIGFPYGDLKDAISVADALLRAGGVPCEPDQLAAAMNQLPSSGSFRTKIATARMFGLIETVQNKYQLTALGFAITDAGRQKVARADAFLNVPLFRKAYDTYRNQQLPPRPVALERAFVGFGVAHKQAANARKAFDNSAQLAGYFDASGRDRLVRPPVGSIGNGPAQEGAPQDAAAEIPASDHKHSQHRHGGGSGSGNHPFIAGLLERLPAPDTVWSIEGQAAWLEAAASAFKLLYQTDGRITITTQESKAERVRTSAGGAGP